MNNDMEELITNYVNNRLKAEERLNIYTLIINNPEFKQRLVDEMEIKKSSKSLKYKLDKESKNRIYQKIINSSYTPNNSSTLLYQQFFLNCFYNLIMPKMALSIFNKIERRWI